ncbi:MAG: putative DNA-binding domain-containing protein [Betaproteobacteria bacterium]|nr:putative DNA-binding domain-containing protein [Betaproteobacteria bacterium]
MDFQAYQRAFTARIRDPKAHPRPPGAPARRMKVYEELLFNNLEGFLLACFPVCRKILGVRRWSRLVRSFFRDHASHTPYFRQIPEEFLRYLQDEWTPTESYPAFLPELAHYEWVELELDTSNRDRDLPAHDPAGDLMAGRPLLNPVLRVLAYRWPVHRLSPRFKPDQTPEQPTFLMAFRTLEDLEVHFTVVNAATARLLSLLQERPGLTGADALEILAREMGADAPAMRAHGEELLADLRHQGVLLGILR